MRETPPQYHADTNRVDVSFEVEVGPVVMIRTTGARFSSIPFMSGREMKKLIPIYSEGTIDPDLVEEGQQNLVDYFQKKGFYDVKVTTDFQRQPDQISLVYKIDRGKKHKVGRIAFRGNDNDRMPAKNLMPPVAIKRSHIWTHGNISQKLLQQSVENLQAFYRDKGYEDVKITSLVAEHDPKIDVTFEIAEGQQTLVDNIHMTGNQQRPLKPAGRSARFRTESGCAFLCRADGGRPQPHFSQLFQARISQCRSKGDGDSPCRRSSPRGRHLCDKRAPDGAREPRGLSGTKTHPAVLIRKTANLHPESPMERGSCWRRKPASMT